MPTATAMSGQSRQSRRGKQEATPGPTATAMSIHVESSGASVSGCEAVLKLAARGSRMPKPMTTATSAHAESGEAGVSRGEAVLTPAARRSHAKADGDGDEHPR